MAIWRRTVLTDASNAPQNIYYCFPNLVAHVHMDLRHISMEESGFRANSEPSIFDLNGKCRYRSSSLIRIHY